MLILFLGKFCTFIFDHIWIESGNFSLVDESASSSLWLWSVKSNFLANFLGACVPIFPNTMQHPRLRRDIGCMMVMIMLMIMIMKEKHDKCLMMMSKGEQRSFYFQGCMPRCLLFALSSCHHHKITIISFNQVLFSLGLGRESVQLCKMIWRAMRS